MQEKIEWKVEKEDCAGQVRGQQWRESKNTASWSVSQEPHPILSYRRSACSVSSAGSRVHVMRASASVPLAMRGHWHCRLSSSSALLSLYTIAFYFKYLFSRVAYLCIALHWLGLLSLRPLPPHYASCSSEAASPHNIPHRDS